MREFILTTHATVDCCKVSPCLYSRGCASSCILQIAQIIFAATTSLSILRMLHQFCWRCRQPSRPSCKLWPAVRTANAFPWQNFHGKIMLWAGYEFIFCLTHCERLHCQTPISQGLNQWQGGARVEHEIQDASFHMRVHKQPHSLLFVVLSVVDI